MNLMDDSSDGLQVEELIKRGTERLKRGDAAAGLSDAQKAVELAPDNAQARALEGLCLKKLGRTAEAAEAMTAAAEAAPLDPLVQSNAAVTLRKLKGPAAALAVVERARARGIADPRMLSLEGFLRFELGKLKPALASFKEALAASPRDERSQQGLALVLRELGEPDAAHQALAERVEAGSVDAHTLVIDGWTLVDRRRYSTALKCFEQALEKVPDHAFAWHGKVACLRLLKQVSAADEALDSARKLLPDDVALLNEEGWLRLDQERLQDAHAVFARVLEIDGGNEFAIGGLARTLRLLDQRDEARATLDHVPERARESALYHSERALLALADHDAGRREDSVLAEAVEAFEAWRVHAPDDLVANAGLGLALWRQRRSGDAVAPLERAVARNPSDPRVPDIRVLLGDLHRELDETAQARAQYEQVLERDPSASHAVFRLAELLEEEGEVATAIEHFGRAADHGDVQAHLWLATHFQREGRFGLAREHWVGARRALEARRADGAELTAGEHYELGCVLLYVDGDADEAERVLRAGVEVAGRTGFEAAELWAALTCLYLSGSETRQPGGRVTHAQKAEDSYRRACAALTARGRDDPEALVRLARLHIGKEKHTEARACLRSALKLDPDDGEAHAVLGTLHGRTGRHDDAVACLKEAVRRDEHDLTLRSQLGKALFLAGYVEAAEREYRRVHAACRDHVDPLVGLGELYVKLGDERDDPDFFEQAIERLTAAIELAGCPLKSRRIEAPELATLHYVRGYARVRLYESAGVGTHEEQLPRAEKDFDQAARLDPDQHMSTRARDKIRKRLKRMSPNELPERIGPVVIASLALAVFLLTQASLIARRPTELDPGMYATLTFGALLFVLSGVSLPRLLRLKIAGMEMEKTTIERAPDPTPLRINVQALRPPGSHTAITLLNHREALKRVEPAFGLMVPVVAQYETPEFNTFNP
jgi:tetratricopeptide (TPR) repeat protein